MIKRIKFIINFLILKIIDLFHSIQAAFGDSYDIIRADQDSRYKKLNLDRALGLVKLNKVLKQLNLDEYNEENGMYSEHMVIIASISECDLYRIDSILEIGTWTGEFALIMSMLFPDATITTIDLPSDEDNFKNFYDRSKNVEQFIESRNRNLRLKDNVNFIEMNSMSLTKMNKETFDLVWVDGAHGYPNVAADILNAYRILKNGGICLIDDVWDNVAESDKMMKSIGAYETLSELKSSNILSEFHLFLKRLGPKKNLRSHKKYVGAFKKLNDSNIERILNL